MARNDGTTTPRAVTSSNKGGIVTSPVNTQRVGVVAPATTLELLGNPARSSVKTPPSSAFQRQRIDLFQPFGNVASDNAAYYSRTPADARQKINARNPRAIK